MSSFGNPKHSRLVTFWLFVMIVLVAGIILLGGATRLTNSGLSITEWRPITGALPPLSEAAWIAEFERYKQIPEFTAEHPDMDLKGFEFIYFMEWSHRQLGRLIGLLYFLPLIYFLSRGYIAKGRRLRFVSVLILIGIQGAIGWWMVKSGLVNDRVDVHPVRLAVHLGMAFIILGILFWTWMDQMQRWPAKQMLPLLKTQTSFLAVLVFLQIIAGALVAGTHAGLSYNTWPLMDGGLVPRGYLILQPWWKNVIENVAAIQFNHRMLGYLVFIVALWVWGLARKQKAGITLRASSWLLAGIGVQIVLGIIALLKLIELPYALAHQAGAIVVFLFAVWTMRCARIRTY